MINALDRGLEILEFLMKSGREVSSSEFAEHLGVDRSTAYRLVSTLAERGFVEQDSETKKYVLGPKLLQLSGALLKRLEVRQRAKPFLRELSLRTGESSHLTGVTSSGVVYIDTEASQARIAVRTDIGMEAPIHCTATGKSVAAYLPEDELDELIRLRGLHAYTPRTITSVGMLKAHLAMVAERGYAVDDEEFDLGIRCVAAPIRSFRNEVVGSIGISGSIVTMTLEKIGEVSPIVVETAERISRNLGNGLMKEE